MWNQNPNFLPSNPSLRKGNDQFGIRGCPNPLMSQKLEPARDMQPWVDQPMTFPNQFHNTQMPPRFMGPGPGPRQRFPNNISQFNASLPRFDNRNIRKNIENPCNIDSWSESPRFPNPTHNFSSFPPENRPQLSDNYNRFRSPTKNFDAPAFDQFSNNNQLSPVSRLNTPLSSLEKRFPIKTDNSLNANKMQLGFDRLNPTQRRWENKSNQLFEQKLNSSLPGPNNFQNQQVLENQFPSSNLPSNFDQSPMAVNRFQHPQQSMKFQRPPMAMDRSPSSIVSQQQNLNYQYSTNTATSTSCNMNQNSFNRFPTPHNFQSQLAMSMNEPTMTSQTSTDCSNVMKDGYKSYDNDLQFSSHLSSQQQNCMSPNFDMDVSADDKLTGLSQFCSPGQQNFVQQDNLQRDDLFGQIPASSTCSDTSFVDNFSHRNSAELAAHGVDIFSPEYKMENVSSLDSKLSKSSQLSSVRNELPQTSMNSSQDNSIPDVIPSSSQPPFNDQLFVDTSSYPTISDTSSVEKMSLFPQQINNSLPPNSKSSQGYEQPPPNIFTQSNNQISRNMINTYTNNTGIFLPPPPPPPPPPPCSINDPLFKSSELYHTINKVPCDTNLYSPGTKLDEQILCSSKPTEIKWLDSYQQTHKLNESIAGPVIPTSVTFSSSHSTTDGQTSVISTAQSSGCIMSTATLPSGGSQSESLGAMQFDAISSQANDEQPFNKHASSNENAFSNKPFPDVFDPLSILDAEHPNPMEVTFLETHVSCPTSKSVTNVSAADFLSNITMEAKPNQEESIICDTSEKKMMSTNLKVPEFSGPCGNLQTVQISQSCKQPNSSSQVQYSSSTLGVYEDRSIKDEKPLIAHDDKSKKLEADLIPMKSLKNAPQNDVLQDFTSDVMHDSSNLCQSSFIDAEFKYNAIPFLSEDDPKSEIEKLGKVISKDEVVKIPAVKEIEGVTAHSAENSSSTVQLEKNEVSVADTKLMSTEPTTSKSTSADLPAFDISQVLSDPKMLNDILHAAKAIQLTDFSQPSTFPSTTSSSKNIAIVSPMQNDGPSVVSSFSRNSGELITSSKFVETRKTLHFSNSVKIKTETSMDSDSTMTENSAELIHAFRDSGDVISSQASKTLLDIQNSSLQAADSKYSVSVQNSSMSPHCEKSNDIRTNENSLKRASTDMVESASKIPKRELDNSKSIDGEPGHLPSDIPEEAVTTSELFSILEQCPVNSDEDADLVVEVMSKLFESYLKFKLRDFPEEERTNVVESLRAGHSKETEKVFKLLQVTSVSCASAATEDVGTTTGEDFIKDVSDFQINTNIEQPSASVPDPPASTTESVSESAISANTTLNTCIASSDKMFVPMPPQSLQAMYSNCPVNMPMSFWMTSGTPLMSIPTMPETMAAAQYPPLPPPPMISVAVPPLPPPPPPQFTMAKPPLPQSCFDMPHGQKSNLIFPPPLPPQLPMDHPPLPPPPPPPSD